MKIATRVLCLAAVAAVATGCAAPPTALEREDAERGRREAAQLLDAFVQAVRAGKHEMLGPVLAPMKAGEGRRLRINLVQANWLEMYQGYTLDYEEALARVPVRSWQKQAFWITVPGSNEFGEPLSDKFELVRLPEGWRISDFALVEPRDGDPLHPPADIQAELRPMAAEALQLLKDNNFVELWYALPDDDDGAHVRETSEQGFWDRVLDGEVPKYVSVEQDLRIVEYLSIWDWPNPDEVTFAYAAGDGIMAVYTVSYTWPEQGINETDTLRIEIIFARKGGDWKFRTIHLRGKAIPYSQ